MTDLKQRALDRIATSDDPDALRVMARNAHAAGDAEVKRAAQLRLYAVSPGDALGTLEHAVWQSIHALEGTLSEERGKTVRLSRTRQKIKRDGEHATVSDLINGKASDGFAMLIERDLSELTFEAVALHFPDRFDATTLAAAEARLQGAGVMPTA